MSREELWAMLQRTSALADRTSEAICQRIATCKGLDGLDSLFTLSERASALFRRIYARYEAKQ